MAISFFSNGLTFSRQTYIRNRFGKAQDSCNFFSIAFHFFLVNAGSKELSVVVVVYFYGEAVSAYNSAWT